MKSQEEIEIAIASVSVMPTHIGDGYGWGGDVILSIGDRAINFGQDKIGEKLALEVAKRWNSANQK
jgi:hypothetical protein